MDHNARAAGATVALLRVRKAASRSRGGQSATATGSAQESALAPAATQEHYGCPPLGEVMSLRILIVDDDRLILEALRVALEPDGHALTTVDDGNAAIDALLAADATGEPFDVVITDLLVPNVGGYTVAATVKRIRPDTPVVLLTGQGESLQKDRLQAYVDRVLSKPPRLSELRAALKELVGVSRRI